MATHWLIVANSAPCDIPTHHLAAPKHTKICACDGAYDWLHRNHQTIDVVIGDMDSIHANKDDLHTAEVIIDHDQDSTDCEKAIRYCQQQQAQHITLIGALNNRLDHSLYNLRLVKRYQSHNCHIELLNDNERIQVRHDGDYQINGIQGQTVSIMGFPEAMIHTKGLQYDVQGLSIGDHADSVSNAMAHHQAHIHIQGCALLITHVNATITAASSNL